MYTRMIDLFEDCELELMCPRSMLKWELMRVELAIELKSLYDYSNISLHKPPFYSYMQTRKDFYCLEMKSVPDKRQPV